MDSLSFIAASVAVFFVCFVVIDARVMKPIRKALCGTSSAVSKVLSKLVGFDVNADDPEYVGTILKCYACSGFWISVVVVPALFYKYGAEPWWCQLRSVIGYILAVSGANFLIKLTLSRFPAKS